MAAPIVNSSDIRKLFQADPVFSAINKLYGSPPNWNRPQGFSTLAQIILEQQVSLQSARAHFNKLNGFIPAFIPQEIVKLTDVEMRLCQISKQKAGYLKALSTAVLEEKIGLEGLSKLPYPVVREQLKQIKGIGDWTVDIYMMFCLQAKDIIPLGDVAVIKTIRELTNAITRDEIILRSENWKPLRSLATFYLWHYYLSKRNRS
jgi:DNA-3-methyladenine glycosylase II